MSYREGHPPPIADDSDGLAHLVSALPGAGLPQHHLPGNFAAVLQKVAVFFSFFFLISKKIQREGVSGHLFVANDNGLASPL